MNYIVLDLEWNCVINYKKGSRAAIEHPSEIIEIGAVKLDEQFKIVDTFSVLIKPFFIKRIQKYILSVTNLGEDDLKDGMPFPEAADLFFKWCGPEYIFCTWGCGDLPELRRNIKYYGLEHEVSLDFIDVQIKYALCFEGERIQRSVKAAVERLEIEDDLEYHRAINDALYTAKILQKIDFVKCDEVEKQIAKMPKVKKKIKKSITYEKKKHSANVSEKIKKPKKVIIITNEKDIKRKSVGK